jgi:hypothetical protein
VGAVGSLWPGALALQVAVEASRERVQGEESHRLTNGSSKCARPSGIQRFCLLLSSLSLSVCPPPNKEILAQFC